MKNTFENGMIVAHGKLFEEVRYDVSNYILSARFDGKGGIEYYSLADGASFAFPVRYITMSYNGKKQDVLLDKKISMLGRKQTIEIDLKTAVLKIEQFLDKKESGIYTCYSCVSEDKDAVLEIGLLGDFFLNSRCADEYTLIGNDRVFVSDCGFHYVEENAAVYFKMDCSRPEFHTRMVCCGAPKQYEGLLSDFDNVYHTVGKEISSVKTPDKLSPAEEALYHSAYWCALENYKEKGDYKGFMAGCRYLSPMRTYYRDSYFTVLPMYNGNLDKVKNQIITLARGISADGACPSAVKSDWSDWWGDHYDSPSFLAMMLYDYINFSGDVLLADRKAGDTTVFEKVVKAIEHLAKYADDTGLLYKAGQYNQRDWADEVNRYGYVTYDEILYARALFCIAEIYKLKKNEERYSHYMERYAKTKDAVNDILWSEEKGYYVNFTNDDYTEDNLSIDTVFAAIFDIADEKRAKRMLLKMEEMLETQNNGVGENFGSMCVYPFYSRLDGAKNKSTQSFNYHNGANWPYLSAMYAYAKRKYAMEYKHLLTVPFEYNIAKGNYTQIEYFSPYCKDGSTLQGWAADAAFVLDEKLSRNFWSRHEK